MATLSTHEKAVIQGLIDYMVDGSAYEKPIDDRVAHDLSLSHVAFGYPSQIVFLEGLRDAPYSTLLRSLLAVSA